MKWLKLLTVTAFMALAAACASRPATTTDEQTEQAKQACYQEHNKTMDKPAVKDVDACWRAHGQQMTK